MNVYRIKSRLSFRDFDLRIASTEEAAIESVVRDSGYATVVSAAEACDRTPEEYVKGLAVRKVGSADDEWDARTLVEAMEYVAANRDAAWDDDERFPGGEAKLWHRDGDFFLAPLGEDHVGNGSGAVHYGNVDLDSGALVLR